MVGLEQEGAARAHRAVDEELDRPQLEPRVLERRRRPPADERDLATGRQRGHAVNPDDRACLRDRARDRRRRPPRKCPRRARRSSPVPAPPAGRPASWRLIVILARGGNSSADQTHGTVDEDAGRVAGGVADDLAARRGLRVLRRSSPAASPRSWPSRRGRRRASSHTGAVRARRGRVAAAVGNSPPGQRLWSQFRPVIHEPAGMARARSFTLRSTSASDATPRRSSCSRVAPSDSMWPCASIKPGQREKLRAIDHARERPAEPIDLGFCAHGCDCTVAHRHCLGPTGWPGHPSRCVSPGRSTRPGHRCLQPQCCGREAWLLSSHPRGDLRLRSAVCR